MDLFVLIREETEKKFPQSGYISVGCFFFLRFMCPFFTVPEGLNVIDGRVFDFIFIFIYLFFLVVTPEIRRALIILSKILQNLANGSFFKENEMTPINNWLENRKSFIPKFFDSISRPKVNFKSDRFNSIRGVNEAIQSLRRKRKEKSNLLKDHFKELLSEKSNNQNNKKPEINKMSFVELDTELETKKEITNTTESTDNETSSQEMNDDIDISYDEMYDSIKKRSSTTKSSLGQSPHLHSPLGGSPIVQSSLGGQASGYSIFGQSTEKKISVNDQSSQKINKVIENWAGEKKTSAELKIDLKKLHQEKQPSSPIKMNDSFELPMKKSFVNRRSQRSVKNLFNDQEGVNNVDDESSSSEEANFNAIAIYDFAHEKPNVLNFKKGDVIKVLYKSTPAWYFLIFFLLFLYYFVTFLFYFSFILIYFVLYFIYFYLFYIILLYFYFIFIYFLIYLIGGLVY